MGETMGEGVSGSNYRSVRDIDRLQALKQQGTTAGNHRRGVGTVKWLICGQPNIPSPIIYPYLLTHCTNTLNSILRIAYL